jgi:hypothetical protein
MTALRPRSLRATHTRRAVLVHLCHPAVNLSARQAHGANTRRLAPSRGMPTSLRGASRHPPRLLRAASRTSYPPRWGTAAAPPPTGTGWSRLRNSPSGRPSERRCQSTIPVRPGCSLSVPLHLHVRLHAATDPFPSKSRPAQYSPALRTNNSRDERQLDRDAGCCVEGALEE